MFVIFLGPVATTNKQQQHWFCLNQHFVSKSMQPLEFLDEEVGPSSFVTLFKNVRKDRIMLLLVVVVVVNSGF